MISGDTAMKTQSRPITGKRTSGMGFNRHYPGHLEASPVNSKRRGYFKVGQVNIFMGDEKLQVGYTLASYHGLATIWQGGIIPKLKLTPGWERCFGSACGKGWLVDVDCPI